MSLLNDRQIDHIVILTGAGVSAESGIATFRDAGGLWENYDPMDLATPEAFASNPDLVYRFYNERREKLPEVTPNAAHSAIASLQDRHHGDVFLVTQNVDDLHERAGSAQVCHMHGELQSVLCQHCGERHTPEVAYSQTTSCPQCTAAGGLRPDVVWFGEMPYHMSRIEGKLARCDLFIAIGTSGAVYPAAGFVRQARDWGALTLEINKQDSDVSSLFHQRRLGMATECVVEVVEELLAGAEPGQQ